MENIQIYSNSFRSLRRAQNAFFDGQCVYCLREFRALGQCVNETRCTIEMRATSRTKRSSELNGCGNWR